MFLSDSKNDKNDFNDLKITPKHVLNFFIVEKKNTSINRKKSSI